MFETSKIWKATLEPQGDQYDPARERLRTAFRSMREKIGYVLTFIPHDCQGLTVHDLTHLDALWEMADVLCEDQLLLNPAEAFVFGAAVLTHDAGLTAAAYPGGLDNIRLTPQWRDLQETARRQLGIGKTVPLPEPSAKAVLFAVLRELHALQAERLADQAIADPRNGNDLYFIDDELIRTAYSQCIGRIARSHHLNIDEIVSLNTTVGAASFEPPSWSVNEIKLACLLRCADAAHIDHRRAPTLLYALVRPEGVSAAHWTFQNKINKPSSSRGQLIYTSGPSFSLQDSEAWWLCYDTIKLINREILQSNALMQDLNIGNGFAITRVVGAESPLVLSKYIRTDGWSPIRAEITVTDPVSVAATLGGKNLYGDDVLAPIRELLQNSVDAIRARRAYEPREPFWGDIKVSVHEDRTTDDQLVLYLTIDDKGIGMSERVLTGPLLDFGRSFWTSTTLREEFPGMASLVTPIGKFGIGFFSVFVLGSEIRVTSRRFDSGAADARTLEFFEISRRPTLRSAAPGELPVDYSTRISIKINNPRFMNNLYRQNFIYQLRHLVCSVDVKIQYSDTVLGQSFVHDANWIDVPNEVFLDELLLDSEDKVEIIEAHKGQLVVLKNAEGEPVGRAALRLQSQSPNRLGGHSTTGFISVGGFVGGATTLRSLYRYRTAVDYRSRRDIEPSFPANYVGVLIGTTNDISRTSASVSVEQNIISEWASVQAALIDLSKVSQFLLMLYCYNIIRLGGDSGTLPFCYNSGRFMTNRQFKDYVATVDECWMPIHEEYNKRFETVSCRELNGIYFLAPTRSEFLTFEFEGPRDTLIEEETGRDIVERGGGELTRGDVVDEPPFPFDLIVEQIAEIWGVRPAAFVRRAQVFSSELVGTPKPRWVLGFSRMKRGSV